MRLIIVRHGESEGNALGISQGQSNFGLTKKGKEQARKLAEFLKSERMSKVYSSDLKRCVNTTNEILKFHKCVKAEFFQDLREQNREEFNGVPREMLYDTIEKSKLPYHLFKPENGESLFDVYHRISQFYEKIISDDEGTVLVVSHGGPISCLLAYIFGEPVQGYKNFVPKGCASLTILNTDSLKIELLNSTAHLD